MKKYTIWENKETGKIYGVFDDTVVMSKTRQRKKNCRIISQGETNTYFEFLDVLNVIKGMHYELSKKYAFNW